MFDLLIDLDDELAHGYEQQQANLLIKFTILNKIMVDNGLTKFGKYTPLTVEMPLTLAKMKDNTLEIQNMERFDKSSDKEGSRIIQTTLFRNDKIIGSPLVVKKYSLNLIPLFKFVDSNKFVKFYYENKKFKHLQKSKLMEIEYLHKPQFSFKNSLKNYCPFDDDSFSDDAEFKNIKQEYIKTPFILTNKNKNNKFHSEQQIQTITPFLGQRTINHKDKDRDKYKEQFKIENNTDSDKEDEKEQVETVHIQLNPSDLDSD
jgi:hypothetical protein